MGKYRVHNWQKKRKTKFVETKSKTNVQLRYLRSHKRVHQVVPRQYGRPELTTQDVRYQRREIFNIEEDIETTKAEVVGRHVHMIVSFQRCSFVDLENLANVHLPDKMHSEKLTMYFYKVAQGPTRSYLLMPFVRTHVNLPSYCVDVKFCVSTDAKDIFFKGPLTDLFKWHNITNQAGYLTAQCSKLDAPVLMRQQQQFQSQQQSQFSIQLMSTRSRSQKRRKTPQREPREEEHAICQESYCIQPECRHTNRHSRNQQEPICPVATRQASNPSQPNPSQPNPSQATSVVAQPFVSILAEQTGLLQNGIFVQQQNLSWDFDELMNPPLNYYDDLFIPNPDDLFMYE